TSDGTAKGTRLAAELLPGTDRHGNANASNPQALTAANGKLYFIASTASGSQALWDLDPATNRPSLLRNLSVPPPPSVTPAPSPVSNAGTGGLLAAGGKVFFAADDGVHRRALWPTDGTARGTAPVADRRPRLARS